VPLRRVDVAGADKHDVHVCAAYVIHQVVQFPLLPLSRADFDRAAVVLCPLPPHGRELRGQLAAILDERVEPARLLGGRRQAFQCRPVPSVALPTILFVGHFRAPPADSSVVIF